jgi:YidC/Oxa1 family membrane protein insertase
MTRSADVRLTALLMTRLRALLRLAPVDIGAAALIALLAICAVVGPVLAVDPTASPGASLASPAASVAATSDSAASAAPAASASAPCPIPEVTPIPSGQPTPTAPVPTNAPHNLCPAVPKGSDPFSIIAWIFTPLFQVIFMTLALFYSLTGDIGIAIVLVTIVIRLILLPFFRRQILSQRRMQMLQPELKAITSKYKGNRSKISEEQMKLYKERGINPVAGCLPTLITLLPLTAMYQVFSGGLSAPDISSMLQVFGHPVITVVCQQPGNPNVPCINPIVPWLFNLDAHHAQVLFFVFGFGISVLAIVSAFLQLIQTRMMQTPSEDPQARSQQRIFLILPLFSLVYGGFLPAGLFIYWITTTIFGIVQQYLLAGYGGLFPIFGWTPGFAKNHKPRFPIPSFAPRVDERLTDNGGAAPSRRKATDNAAGTIRPVRTKARTSRRGRRR